MINKSQFKKCFPHATQANIDRFYEPLIAAMNKYEILKTNRRAAAFLAQIAHETISLSKMEENLNYSAARLLQVFPNKFTKQEADIYARNPERIANRVYADRYGNGPESSGDGWEYRGRGGFHLTFKDNYYEAGKGLNYDLVGNPEAVSNPGPAMFTAAWFWDTKELNRIADVDGFQRISIKINGGLNGYEDRLKHWAICKEALGVI